MHRLAFLQQDLPAFDKSSALSRFATTSVPMVLPMKLVGVRISDMKRSMPKMIEKIADGKRYEPYENVWIEVPDECVGAIMQNLANRKGQMTNVEKHPHSSMIEAIITTRGLIGMAIDVVSTTSGRWRITV